MVIYVRPAPLTGLAFALFLAIMGTHMATAFFALIAALLVFGILFTGAASTSGAYCVQCGHVKRFVLALRCVLLRLLI